MIRSRWTRVWPCLDLIGGRFDLIVVGWAVLDVDRTCLWLPVTLEGDDSG